MEVETVRSELPAVQTTLMDMKSSKASSLEDLCQKLHRIFDDDSINVEEVQQLMTSYKSNRKDWDKYANFDRHRYTRNLVDMGNGKYNLMLLCWNEGDGSSIHDHADCHCFMKTLQGELSEIRFAWPSDTEETSSLKEIGRNSIHLEEVSYMNDSLGLHRVENESHTEQAVSLHLYCPPYDECHMFDQNTGHKTPCKVAFWSRYGTRTAFITKNGAEIAEND